MQNILLSQGATAEVFALGTRYVLKLFYADVPRAMVEYEVRMARLVQQAGFVTPTIAAILAHGHRLAIVYDRIAGATMLQHVVERPWAAVHAGWQFASVHAQMHRHHQPQLPARQDQLHQMIMAASPLSASLKAVALHRLEQLPNDTAVCHGDYHPGNILLAPHGPVVIDWVSASAGHPLTDVARAALVLRFAEVPPYFNVHARQQFMFVRQIVCAVYLSRYRMIHPYEPIDLDRWLLPVAAARLSERVPAAEVTRLIRLVQRLAQRATA